MVAIQLAMLVYRSVSDTSFSTHRIHVWYMFPCFPDFHGKLIGKYTSRCSHGPTSTKKAGQFGGGPRRSRCVEVAEQPEVRWTSGAPSQGTRSRGTFFWTPGWHVAIWRKSVKPNWKWSRFLAKWIPFPLWTSGWKRFTTRCLRLSVHFQISKDVSC